MESQNPELKTVEQMEEKVELPNQCLGKKCTKMLPKGKHICDCCRKKINTKSKLASKTSSGNGRRSGRSSMDI